MISIEEALTKILEVVDPLPSEVVPFQQAVGRTLTQSVIADVDSPPHTKSIMDGYAVRAEDISRDCSLKLLETVIAGGVPEHAVSPGTCSRIMTGAPMPQGADAVVMVEQTSESNVQGDTLVSFEVESLASGKHVMQRAASFGKGEVIFSVGHELRPLDIGLLAEVGAAKVSVVQPIQTAVLPTGNELVSADKVPGHGQIRNSNGPMLAAQLRAANANVIDLGIGRDDRDELSAKIEDGLDADLLVLSGGVSAGTMDLVPELLQNAGVEQVFHKVRVKPGKPIWFGVRDDGNSKTYVFGLPGNPVSSLVGCELFVKSAMRRMNGADIWQDPLLAELVEAHEARGDRPTYWPGQWVNDESKGRKVRPCQWLGSSDLRALGFADVLIYFPSEKNFYEAGESVQVVTL